MFLAIHGTKTGPIMKLSKKYKLIAAVKHSNLSKKEKTQIIKILLTHNIEKSLPLILQTLGAAEAIIRLFPK